MLIRIECKLALVVLTVVVWRSECVLLHRPTRWENDEISDGRPGPMTWTRQNSEYAGILSIKKEISEGVGDMTPWEKYATYTMIEANRIDDHKFGQIIFVWCIIAVPGDHIEWGMIEFGRKQSALVFGNDLEFCESSES